MRLGQGAHSRITGGRRAPQARHFRVCRLSAPLMPPSLRPLHDVSRRFVHSVGVAECTTVGPVLKDVRTHNARRRTARNRSSSIELVGKPVLTLGRAAVSERQITLEGGLQAQKFAGCGCRRCCTMCSHRRILCEVVSHTNSASTLPAMAHGRQAVHQLRAYLASLSLPTVHTTHASYGADTLAASFQHRLVLGCGLSLLLCVYPLCSCHSAAASSAQKEVKLVKCDRKVKFSLALRGREEGPCGHQRRAKKRALFK